MFLMVVPALALLAAALISLTMLGIATYSVVEWVRGRSMVEAVSFDSQAKLAEF